MKKKLHYCLCTFLVLSIYGFSQTPCTAGFAEVSPTERYPCLGYDLLSHIPIATLANAGSGQEANDVWGWTDSTTNKEYALAGTTNGTSFVDITNAANPILLGTLPTENPNNLDCGNGNVDCNIWRDIKVYGNYAFIVSEATNHGMQVFDLTRLRNVARPPETFTADYRYTGVTDCHNIVINEATSYAYLVGCDTYSRGVTILDISNPLLPTDVGGYSADGYTHDAQVVTYSGPDTRYTGQEILIGSYGAGLNTETDKIIILDVTDKNNIIKISETTYPQAGYTHQGWFTDDQQYFILGDETDEIAFGFNTRTLIFDFSDLTAPVLETTYIGTTSAIDHNGYVLGNKFFLANYTAGMRVLDIPTLLSANNTNSEIGFFDTFPASNSASFNGGAWSIYPYFPSGNIIINDIANGLFVVGDINALSTNNIETATNFSLSPNPASNTSLIESTDAINVVEVYNLLGQKVYYKDNINLNEFVLPLQGLAKGVYLVKINSSVVKKLILE